MSELGKLLKEFQGQTLEQLSGDASELVNNLRIAHKRVTAAKANIRDLETFLEDIRIKVVSQLVASGEHGNNDKVRALNETIATLGNATYVKAYHDLSMAKTEYEEATAELSVLENNIKIMMAKAGLMSSMLNFVASRPPEQTVTLGGTVQMTQSDVESLARNLGAVAKQVKEF